MGLGLYIHIPFCLQRCYYCDFATYTQDESKVTTQEYIEALITEIVKVSKVCPTTRLKTIYFGGGTPSLLSVKEYERLFDALKANGFSWTRDTEITVEINPATLDIPKVTELKMMGVNRFSVGAQTFNDKILKKLNRKHSVSDTYDTLNLLQRLNCNYSFDLLFSLPGQSIDDLLHDLEEIKNFSPPHISPYYLTLPQSHMLNTNRPNEDDELVMFRLIRSFLTELNYEQYEISNFAKSFDARSKHNTIYWDDSSYLGIGLSSHSYFSDMGLFGTRFSNPKNMADYLRWVGQWMPTNSILDGRPPQLIEELKAHESLTDFCHTSLRRIEGLCAKKLQLKYGSAVLDRVRSRLKSAIIRNLVDQTACGWTLTDQGKDLSNQVFLDLTFLATDYPSAP